MGKKDIIKIEGPITVNLDILGVLDEHITINVIKDNAIAEKRTLALPEMVTGVIKCKNPRCITSIEQELPHRFKLTDKENRVYRCLTSVEQELPQVFKLTDREKRIYRCLYCEQKFSRRH